MCLKKSPLKITLGSVKVFFKNVGLIGIIVTIIVAGLYFYFSEKSAKQRQGEQALLIEGLLENLGGIDCSDLKSLWVASDEAIIEDQYFSLNKGELKGTITFRRPFYNLFILDLIFTPFSSIGANTSISFKDEDDNEFILTIGDGDYKSIRLVSRKEGETIENLKEIIPLIKRGEEIKLRIETVLRAKSILISGILYYAPENKPNEIIPMDIKEIELPYEFKNDKFNLHIGLIGNEKKEESETKIKFIDCLIEEKEKPWF